MSENRIGICSCGAQLTSPYSSDVNNFLEIHNKAHGGINAGTTKEKTAVPQSESEKFFAHLNNGEVLLVEESRWEERQKQLLDITGGVIASMEHLLRYRIVITPKEVKE